MNTVEQILNEYAADLARMLNKTEGFDPKDQADILESRRRSLQIAILANAAASLEKIAKSLESKKVDE
jgi:hypothetical protein